MESVEVKYDEIFGEFRAEGEDSSKWGKTTIATIDDGRAHKCNQCGSYPRLHDVFFKDGRPDHFYMDCGVCGECDGNWYTSVESAISAWNLAHPNEDTPLDEDKFHHREFVNDIVERIHFAV